MSTHLDLFSQEAYPCLEGLLRYTTEVNMSKLCILSLNLYFASLYYIYQLSRAR